MDQHRSRLGVRVVCTLVLPFLVLASEGSFAQASREKAARFYEDALQRYERKDIAGSIIQLKNALQIDRTMLPSQVLLGKALLANGEAAAAEVAFDEAWRLGVNRAEVVVPYAQALAAQGKQPKIFEDQRLSITGLPGDAKFDLLLVRAAAASDLGDARGALKSIDEARLLRPDKPESFIAEVPVRIRARQPQEAFAAANQALKLNPRLAEAHYQKGSIEHVLAQMRPALESYDTALSLDPGHIEARIARAGIRLDLDQFAEAKADLKELASLAPGEPRTVYLGALMAEREGDMAAARAELKRVTELLDPIPIDTIRFRPQVLMLNGMAHFGLNQLEKAKPYLEYALRQQPNSPLAKMLAQIAMAEPNPTRAVELLEGYLKARPGDGQAMLMLASAHMAQGRHGKATALMQEALRAREAPEFRTALGLSLMRGGQTGNAVAELERAFKADPRQTYAALALVNLYLRGGQTAKALAIAEGLVKSDPKSPSAQMVLGTARLSSRDYKGARSAFEQANKIDPSLLEPRLGLARTEIATRSFEAARKRLSELLKERERNVDALFEMAILSEAMGKNEEALKWLESAAEASSQRETRANFALVAWLLRTGDSKKALDAAKQLLAKLPEDVQALQAYAAAQLATTDTSGARSTLANASRRAGFDAMAQVEIAQAQVRAADLAGAAYSLEKALSAQADYLPALALMTAVELQQGETARAERRARLILQNHPKLSIGHNLMSDVAIKKKQVDAAIESLRRAHEIDRSTQSLLRLFDLLARQPDIKPAMKLAEDWLKAKPADHQVHKALGDARARAGSYKDAKRSYEAALQLRPDDLEALNNLANVLIRLKDPGALKVAEQALSKDPRNPILVDTAGWANHLAGNKDRALQLLRDARLRAPDSAEIRYHLAVALIQAGRVSEAKAELDAALKSGSFEEAAEATKLRATLN